MPVPQAKPALDPALRAELACTRLCVDFTHHIDARRNDEVLDLFTEDGSLDRLGTMHRGREEIRRFLEGRPADVATRHVCTNLRVWFRADDEATGLCYVSFFSARTGAGLPRPLAVSPPTLVEYHDLFRRTAAGWRIHRRSIRPAFG